MHLVMRNVLSATLAAMLQGLQHFSINTRSYLFGNEAGAPSMQVRKSFWAFCIAQAMPTPAGPVAAPKNEAVFKERGAFRSEHATVSSTGHRTRLPPTPRAVLSGGKFISTNRSFPVRLLKPVPMDGASGVG